jgi:hypothetical protein
MLASVIGSPARLKFGSGLWEPATPTDIVRSAIFKTKESRDQISPLTSSGSLDGKRMAAYPC